MLLQSLCILNAVWTGCPKKNIILDTIRDAGIFALVVILFEGGMQTSIKDIRPVMASALSLATIGVLLTTVIVMGFNKGIVTPHGSTVILPGDTVYVLSPKAKREEMRAVFRSGKGIAAKTYIPPV